MPEFKLMMYAAPHVKIACVKSRGEQPPAREPTPSTRWRLVCHRCGTKQPWGCAVAVGHGNTSCCCSCPDLRIHVSSRPCALCADEAA